VDGDERARLIRRYRDGYREVKAALDGITDEELDQSAEDGWTPRQVIQHLADAEIIGAARIRLLLAQPEPVIQGYDQELFANTLMYDHAIEPYLEAMRWARETSGSLLEKMSDEDWSRAGTHTDRGRFTTEDWLTMYAAHAHDHAAQIRRARGRV
jgi:DinB family protein